LAAVVERVKGPPKPATEKYTMPDRRETLVSVRIIIVAMECGYV